MSPQDAEHWKLVNAELDRLLDLGEGERATLLASLRRRDPALAADVERLLAEQRQLQAAGFLEHGAAALLPTATGPEGNSGPMLPAMPAALAPGSIFGPYRIASVLGRGGMAMVYEADEIASGRRVALKVLSERLGDGHERERFEREGRLAASITHDHCVFVFAAAEIDGRPAIAMERMAGTLADRLAEQAAPLPPAEAVDAALQLVAGLDAAAAAGILHRDVKPSNCFVDADGVVKIGDFGISRSLRPSEETALTSRGRFAATPAYASPEQLSGAALDRRADIYSLGATLYELLTARRPFQRPDLMALLMAVANDRPVAPHVANPAVPKGLSDVVMRCLAKQPDHRYADYDALTAALEPYGSAAPTPATVGRRFLAGLGDQALLFLINFPVMVAWISTVGTSPDTRWLWTQQVGGFLLLLAYYGISEGIWSATPGKMLCSLRLVDAHGRPATGSRVVVRAALFLAPPWVTGALWIVFAPLAGGMERLQTNAWWGTALSVTHFVLLAGLFSTARRRNGYAAFHDLATGLRVVERRLWAAANDSPAQVVGSTPAPEPVARLGPFDVWPGGIDGMPEGWRPGFDPRLRRPVWIRILPPGSPPVSPARASLARATRLRWLAGQRTAREAWDVFEQVEGRPAVRRIDGGATWDDVRRWLRDLASELAAITPGDRPLLRLDRVWVLSTGGAKLVDDPVVDEAAPHPADALSLLREVARAARARASGPWPLSAERFVEQLEWRTDADARTVTAELASLRRTRPSVSRRWRAAALLLTIAGPTLITLFMSVAVLVFSRVTSALPVDSRVTVMALQRLWAAKTGRQPIADDEREDLEALLATRYRPVLADGRLFTPRMATLGLFSEHRQIAADILARRPAGAARPEAVNHPQVRALVQAASTVQRPPPVSAFAAMIMGVSLVFVALVSVLTALAFRGGVLRLLGFELVTADGRPATRLRVLARTSVTWSPLPVFVAAMVLGTPLKVTGGGLAAVVLMMACLLTLALGAAVAIARPARGWQDRVAGTWIVPR